MRRDHEDFVPLETKLRRAYRVAAFAPAIGLITAAMLAASLDPAGADYVAAPINAPAIDLTSPGREEEPALRLLEPATTHHG